MSDPLGSWVAALAIRFHIHPTVVTTTGLGLAVIASTVVITQAQQLHPGWAPGLVAVLFWQLVYILDCADGQIARAAAIGVAQAAMAAQPAGLPAPALVVVDGETEITDLAQDIWPGTPIQRCWWHLPHGLRKAYLRRRRRRPPRQPPLGPADVRPARRAAPRGHPHEQTTDEALTAYDAFTDRVPATTIPPGKRSKRPPTSPTPAHSRCKVQRLTALPTQLLQRRRQQD